MSDIDTINDHLVGVQGSKIVILMPPRGPMPIDEALRMAAYIVSCASADELFAQILEAVRNT